MLLYDLDEIAERMKLYGVTVLGVLLVSPPCRAAALDKAPRGHRDSHCAPGRGHYYRYRKPATIAFARSRLSRDELGVLVDRFNEMLAGIQSRDHNLRTALRDRGRPCAMPKRPVNGSASSPNPCRKRSSRQLPTAWWIT